jgi:hypothetical protein
LQRRRIFIAAAAAAVLRRIKKIAAAAENFIAAAAQHVGLGKEISAFPLPPPRLGGKMLFARKSDVRHFAPSRKYSHHRKIRKIPIFERK